MIISRGALKAWGCILCAGIAGSAWTQTANRAAGFAPGFWDRAPIPNANCGKSRQALVASIGTTDAKAFEAKIRDVLSGYRAVDLRPECGIGYSVPFDAKPGAPVITINVWIDDIEIEGLKARLSRATTGLRWEVPRSINGVPPSAEERWRLLKTELIANEALLEHTPHVRTLVKSEIARLEPAVKSYLETRYKTQLSLVLYSLR